MSAGKSARLSIREIAELSLFCALMVAGKECLRLIPNVHPVTLLLLLATAVYGAKALYPAFGFALLEIALYGAGLWNLMYLYVWPIVVLAALPFRRIESRAFWAAIAGLHGLCFGALCAIPYFFIGGWQMAFSWWEFQRFLNLYPHFTRNQPRMLANRYNPFTCRKVLCCSAFFLIGTVVCHNAMLVIKSIFV